MKAAIYTRYGGPEVVSLAEIPVPVPKGHEVLVRVHVSTVNRTDCGFRSAQYFISRLFSGLFNPRNKILGCEFSGVIEAVGSDVTNFKVGSRIFGYDDDCRGGLSLCRNGAENRECDSKRFGVYKYCEKCNAEKEETGKNLMRLPKECRTSRINKLFCIGLIFSKL